MKIFLIVIIVVVVGSVFLLVNKSPEEGELSVPVLSEATPTATPSATPTATPMVKNENEEEEEEPQQLENKIMATMTTSKGDIVLELYPLVAPKTVFNFINLSQKDFYNGTKFHRVIPSFMIQGGDPLSKDEDPLNDGTGGPGYVFEDEINPKILGLSGSAIDQLEAQGYVYNFDLDSIPVEIGTIAMANAGPNTNGSQFFIVTVRDQPHLNGKHTVFGRVVEGMDIVLSIQQGDEIISIKTSL